MTADRQYVFATGCARSGTTALARLLNLHPDVCVGYERFAKRALAGELAPSLFEPDRFIDFRSGDSHWSEPYPAGNFRADVLSKIRTASVVGDKFPRLVENLDQLERFPNVKVIFIVREPLGVAKSFDKRAANPDDSWDSERDYRAAIKQFNGTMLTISEELDRKRFDCLVVNYSKVFDDPAEHTRLFDFLNVDPKKLNDTSHIVEYAQQKKLEEHDSALMEYILTSARVGKYRTVIDTERRQRAAFGS